MELYPSIKFGNKLIKNGNCDITYSGYLFENNSDIVKIVYGFGPEWKHTTEKSMEKTDDGFVVNVTLRDYDTFSFCFKNERNEWDNNYNQNFTASLEEQTVVENAEPNFIINDENVAKDILENLCKYDLSDIYADEAKEKAEAIENASFEVEVEINEPVNIEDSFVNATEAATLEEDLENIFSDIYENAVTLTESAPVQESVQTITLKADVVLPVELAIEEAIEEALVSPAQVIEQAVEIESVQNIEVVNEPVKATTEVAEFNMDNLIDEILAPIFKSSVFEEESTESLENYQADTNPVNFFEEFEEFEDVTLDNKIDNLIADLFNNTKQAKAEQQKVVESNIEAAIDNRINELIETSAPVQEIESAEQDTDDTIEDTTIEFIEETEEESLMENIEESTTEQEQTTALVEVPETNGFVVSARTLGKFYMFKKKVKLAFTKLFVALPRFLSRGFNEDKN